MTGFDDGRVEAAKSIPIAEVADRLALTLRRSTAVEHCGPCPSCGGRDRFAINTAKDVWGCRKCGEGGDQIELVKLAHGCSFPHALDWLVGEAEAAIDPEVIEKRRAAAQKRQAQQKEYAERARARARAQAREIWRDARGGDPGPVLSYLAARGIDLETLPPTIRCLENHPYRRKVGGKVEVWHTGPAMIAAIQDASGAVCAVHQTWLDPAGPSGKAQIKGPDGEDLPAKLVRGSKKGNAIRLTPAPPSGGTLIMGEGIETTASAMVADPIPGSAYWVGVDLGNLAGLQIKEQGKRNSGIPDMTDLDAFLPPPWTGCLVYLQDGDSAPAATRAKLLAGLRRAQKTIPGLEARIVSAPTGVDWNDVLRGRAQP